MSDYDLGDAVTLRTEVRDTDGALIDATVAITVTAPDGTSSTPSVSHDSTGNYSTALVLDQTKTWFYRWNVTGAVTAVESGQITVGDPRRPTYASLADLRLFMNLPDRLDDTLLDKALRTASRAIEERAGRRFDLATTATARSYLVRDPTDLFVDDIGDTTDLIVQTGRSSWTAVGATDYELLPENAIAKGRPVNCLRMVSGSWPYDAYTQVKVTALWGWPAIPDAIEQATLIQASRLFRRKDSPEGILGNTDFGPIRLSRLDPDVESLVAPLAIPGI